MHRRRNRTATCVKNVEVRGEGRKLHVTANYIIRHTFIRVYVAEGIVRVGASDV